MSITSFLLLSLLCIGVTKAHVLEYGAPTSTNHFFPPNSAAERTAKGFLIFFQLNIEHRDMAQLSQKISDNFMFHACKLSYNKQNVLGHLKNLPSGSKVSLNLKSAQFINGYDVQFTVLISGLGKLPFLAQLVIHRKNGNYVLTNGKVYSCSRRQLIAPGSIVKRTVYGILAKIRMAINDHNVQKISVFFSDKFIFKGCTSTVNKEEAVDMLSHLGSGTNFKISLLYADLLAGEAIEFAIKISGLGPAWKDEYILEKENGSYVLTMGRALDCDKPYSTPKLPACL